MQLAFVPPAGSPIRRQYLRLKQQHSDAILFFQLGDFYETFEDDARIVAEVCDVALTSREMGQGERLPMAGVPVQAADPYIARLIQRGYHVAICQQVETAAATAGGARPDADTSLVRREITRVITPGTLVDSTLLTAERSNYLVALATDRRCTGLAYADISTGEFGCTEIEDADHRELARCELARLQPAECLLPEETTAAGSVAGSPALTVDEGLFAAYAVETTLCTHFQVASIGALGLGERPAAARAAAAILRYLQRTQARAAGVLDTLRLYDVSGHMVLDPTTRDQLEIMRGSRNRREGSLLHALDRTVTAMGARLLAHWVGQPLLDRAAIEARLDGVAALHERPGPRQRVQAALDGLPDLERLAGRAAQRLLTPRDALALASGIDQARGLPAALDGLDCAPLAGIRQGIDPPSSLAEEIRATVMESPPLAFGEGVIRPGKHPELDELRAHSADGRQWLLDLERRERERTGIKNLKVGYNRVFGYYLEATTAALAQPLDYYRQTETGAQTAAELLERFGYRRRQTLTAAERFVTDELREHEVRQTRSAARRAELEREVYEQLARQVASHVPQLLRVAAAIAELDALASYAQVAHERRFVRPEIADEPETMILGGRHPVVESALGWDAYMPADIHLGVGDGATGRQGDRETGGRADEDNGSTDPPVSPSPRPPVSPSIVVLTGPNMAGKTTYGRMVLLVALMGQCGSFVPADRARLGLVDRVFLRSGAGDDIAGGQSTFMVEMTETAAILRNATRRSLAFFDEVGRGTSTYDGMSIAHAIVEYLASPRRGCRAIFSTHYHELAAIEQHHPTVRNYRMDVQEMPGRIAFTYRVVPGSADRSYGVHVAQLAGLPASVIERATAVLQSLEAQRGGREGHPLPEGEGGGEGVPSGSSSALDTPQSAVGSRQSALLEELADVDVERTTPLEALALLGQLQTQARQLLSPQEADARQKSPAGGANGSSKTSGPARKSKRGARI